jgi:pseudaminic acid synthase
MKIKFKLGRKFIGDNLPCLIVAELSGNHRGRFSRVKNLIIKAKKSGADLIKLQTYTPDTITLNSHKKDFRINKNTPWKKNKNLWDLYNKAYTPWEWHKKIFELGKKLQIDIFSSPFDETAVDLLESLNCPAYKIASAEINHIPLLIKVAQTKKPIILSIGLASLKDLQFAIKVLKKNGSKKIIILQCVSSYPSPVNEQNLKTLPALRKKFNSIVGLSDHTLGISTPIAATVLGASLIEKHFNLDDDEKTVDSFFSLKEENFKKMVVSIREVEASLGTIEYGISKSSKKNLNSRRSIYISKRINKGEKISLKNIRVVRPSFGLHPKYFKKVLGKKINKNLNFGDRLMLKYVSKD